MGDKFSNLPNPACGGADHTLHRRKFLQGMAGAGAFSLMSWGGLFSLPAFAGPAEGGGGGGGVSVEEWGRPFPIAGLRGAGEAGGEALYSALAMRRPEPVRDLGPET